MNRAHLTAAKDPEKAPPGELRIVSSGMMYREYAQRRQLLTSAGSDSHRPDKPPIKYRAELCRDLLERVGIQIECGN